MQPEYFGPPGHELFGIFHARGAQAPARAAVLLCNAFGRESVQLHRLFRVLADRLSRAGCDVLRFDYYGTGDSAGDDTDADLEGFCEDLLRANAELTRRAPGMPVTWVGARLGANVAALASRRVSPARLVLLDPIADGRDYLDALRTQHAETLIESQRAKLPPARVSFRDDESQYLEEASGFALPRRLCDQLRAVRFTAPGTGVPSVVICDSQTPNGKHLAAQCAAASPPVRVANFSHGADWTSSLVPPQVMNLLIAESEGRA